MEETKELTMAVSSSRYEELIKNEAKLSIITEMLFSSAKINRYAEELTFDDDVIDSVLKALFPLRFSNLIKSLNGEEEKE